MLVLVSLAARLRLLQLREVLAPGVTVPGPLCPPASGPQVDPGSLPQPSLGILAKEYLRVLPRPQDMGLGKT